MIVIGYVQLYAHDLPSHTDRTATNSQVRWPIPGLVNLQQPIQELYNFWKASIRPSQCATAQWHPFCLEV